MVWPAIIGAAGAVAGGLLNNAAAEEQGDQQVAMHRENLQMQREFAQRGIRWRVEDAQAAGVHPLFALGASIPTYSPSTYMPGNIPDNAGWLSQAGQDIGRAIDATRTGPEKVGARLQALSVERAELENDLLRSQIARNNQQTGPAMPVANPGLNPGGPMSDKLTVTVDEKPMERTVSDPVKPWSEPAAIPDVGWIKTPTGLVPAPSKDAKERLEDMAIPELMWSLRNNLLPNFGSGDPPPRSLLPEGAVGWKWSYTKQEWQPAFIEKGFRAKDVRQ